MQSVFAETDDCLPFVQKSERSLHTSYLHRARGTELGPGRLRAGARPELRSNYSEEVVAMKELANAAECMARCEDGMHAPQMGSPFPTAQSIYAQRPETEDDPYAMPYDVLHRNGAEEGDAGCQNHLERNTLKRRPDLKEHRSNNIYISRQSLTRTKPRERPYESLMVNMNPYPADGTTTSTLSRKEHEDVQV